MEVIQSNKISGKTFVFSGSLNNFSRSEASNLLLNYGAIINNSVSNNTDFLVVGKTTGKKLDKAHRLGVQILDEDEFNQLIESL